MVLTYPVDDDRARVNLEESVNLPQLQQFYFTFGRTDVGKSRLLKRLPSGSMVYGVLTIRVEEGFDGGETELRIGTDADNSDIVVVSLAPKGVVVNLWPGERENHMQILRYGANIKMSLLNTETPVPTLGRGWGILQWLDMNRVEGYK